MCVPLSKGSPKTQALTVKKMMQNKPSSRYYCMPGFTAEIEQHQQLSLCFTYSMSVLGLKKYQVSLGNSGKMKTWQWYLSKCFQFSFQWLKIFCLVKILYFAQTSFTKKRVQFTKADLLLPLFSSPSSIFYLEVLKFSWLHLLKVFFQFKISWLNITKLGILILVSKITKTPSSGFSYSSN